MRTLDGEQTLVRVFMGESDHWHHRPLHGAILERLRKEGFAGATVYRGISGFGAASVIHRSTLVDLSVDLPIVLEVVEDEEHVEKLLAMLDEMVTKGALVTVEKVRVVKYAPGAPRSSPP